MDLLLVVVASFVAAAMNSIAGGGTFLTFPTLTEGLQLTPKVANMTSTIGLWPGSAASIYAARPDFKRIPTSILVSYSIISIVGGIAGAILLRYFTSAETFTLIIPWLLLFATCLFALSKPIARWAGAKHGEPTLFWTVAVGCIQMVVAVYGGYFGAGIGVLMLAGLSFSGLDDIRQMNALKVLLATIINGVAAAVFLWSSIGVTGENAVAWPIAGAMAVASIVGGFLGMGFARRIPQVALRIIVLIVGSALTVIYFAKAYGGA